MLSEYPDQIMPPQPAPPAVMPPAASGPPPAPGTPPPGKKPPWLIIGVIAVLLVCMLCGCLGGLFYLMEPEIIGGPGRPRGQSPAHDACVVGIAAVHRSQARL